MSKNKLSNYLFFIGLIIGGIGFLLTPSNMTMMLVGSGLIIISNIK